MNPAKLVLKVSPDGTGNWKTLHTFTSPLPEIAAFGRFDDIAGADVIVWHALALNIISSATGPEVRFSRQEMR